MPLRLRMGLNCMGQHDCDSGFCRKNGGGRVTQAFCWNKFCNARRKCEHQRLCTVNQAPVLQDQASESKETLMKHFTLYPGRQTRECQSDSKVRKDAAICGSASILSLCVWVGYGSKMNTPGLKALLRFLIRNYFGSNHLIQIWSRFQHII